MSIENTKSEIVKSNVATLSHPFTDLKCQRKFQEVNKLPFQITLSQTNKSSEPVIKFGSPTTIIVSSKHPLTSINDKV